MIIRESRKDIEEVKGNGFECSTELILVLIGERGL